MSIENAPKTSVTPAEEVRPIDPNVKQWAASNPLENVWVSASAGTGKTKVLSDRVLRLLLPRADGNPGTLPHRILCLTYTKAAASEMMLRINKRLGDWVVMSDEALHKSIRATTGAAPTPEMLQAARQLFARVVDTPGGLKIMTIHAFCQSVLGRFPLEADILPHTDILDEGHAKSMIQEALRQIARDGAEQGNEYTRLSIELAENTLMRRVQDCLGEGDQIESFFEEYPDETARRQVLRDIYAAENKTDEELIGEFCQSVDKGELRTFAEALSKGSATDQGRSSVLYDWLSGTVDAQQKNFSVFRSIFLSGSGKEVRSPSKGAVTALERAPEIQTFYAEKLLGLEDKIKAGLQVELTLDLLNLSRKVQQDYTAQKRFHGLLDYNDLILKTLGLLKRAQKSVPWVLYKLDGGLDHILVDEAQDTNPAQWDIISLLVEEFFNDQTERPSPRTLFVVGDEKQSIYRFQGAALEEFQYMRFSLAEKAKAARAAWRNENLQISFRSTRSVLGFVDAAFRHDAMRKDIGVPEEEELQHLSHRAKQAGQVTLWPLMEAAKSEEAQPWEPPVTIRDIKTPKAALAEQIAETVQTWINNKRILPSKNAPIRPKDIMVLVRSRDAFVDLLVRALKSRFIPVSGADRLVLNQHIAIQDLCSLAKFVLQPKDNLSLAEILTSPFVGISAQELEDLSYGRDKKPLWHVLRAAKPELSSWFERLQQKASQTPFSFFFEVLNEPCPADEVSGLRALRKRLGEDCLDVIDEFLSAVQGYERDGIPTLQSFMVWQVQNPIEIKREFDAQGDMVRIMTVHGAKGLQAPIVFLPDTLRTNSAIQNKIPRLLMPRRTGAKVPLWSPRSHADCRAYKTYFDKIAAQETAEYKRLFYVAATRAEDELIICGAQPKTTSSDESWYEYARAAFEELGSEVEEEESGVCLYRHEAIGEADRQEENLSQQNNVHQALPVWVYQKAPVEPEPARPYRPSRPSDSEPSVFSPLARDDQYRFRRGLITHTLLQFLPILPPEKWEQAGATFLSAQAQDLSENIRADVLRETLGLMKDSAFAEIFSRQAQAEVSVSGYLPSGRLISGQIDRLLVKEGEVLIIDYKTNRPPPVDVKEVPVLYRNQMTAYKEALEKVYPAKKIRAALLWTYGPYLMELTDL